MQGTEKGASRCFPTRFVSPDTLKPFPVPHKRLGDFTVTSLLGLNSVITHFFPFHSKCGKTSVLTSLSGAPVYLVVSFIVQRVVRKVPGVYAPGVWC